MNADQQIDTPPAPTSAQEIHYIHIAQGAVGVLEDGCEQFGFYTDKIETCRPYVFVCENGTLMIHDTSQIQFDALGDFVAQYGAVKGVHYAESYPKSESLHSERLDKLAQRLTFNRQECHVLRMHSRQTAFNVSYSSRNGLKVVLEKPQLAKVDSHHDRREAVNKLNDNFTPPRSQSAPLDIQYRNGSFTEPPSTVLSTVEMFHAARADAKVDQEWGFISISAIYQIAPIAGHSLPVAFERFVERHQLASYSSGTRPAWCDTPKLCRAVVSDFRSLEIFKKG
ncbi:hypothetical protein [Collimonas sp.]|jgi:hypothetical protein|uniref:hypothetical protein n=1 Tax=Collimonas sp. TaxID=1963772 RepID=UPI002BF4447B|nr:hypothetical protein [Collimonas sp.]HWW07605.1 hypothetical protein [Collimonas sp.]